MDGRVTLNVVEGPLEGKQYVLDEPGQWIAGRAPDCHIRLPQEGHEAAQGAGLFGGRAVGGGTHGFLSGAGRREVPDRIAREGIGGGLWFRPWAVCRCSR